MAKRGYASHKFKIQPPAKCPPRLPLNLLFLLLGDPTGHGDLPRPILPPSAAPLRMARSLCLSVCAIKGRVRTRPPKPIPAPDADRKRADAHARAPPGPMRARARQARANGLTASSPA